LPTAAGGDGRFFGLLRICHKSCGRIGAFMLEGGVFGGSESETFL
jgi:hypothetical protein